MKTAAYPVTISLVTWNGARWLPFCLAALQRLEFQNFFLMVVDNASLDGSADIAERFMASHPSLAVRSRLVRNRVNLGFARAHNQAIAWTESEYVFVLNQDVLLEPSYLGEVMGCLANDERAAAAAGTLLRWSLDPATFVLGSELSAEQVVDSCGLAVQRTRRIVNDFQGAPLAAVPTLPRRVFGISATGALYRRSALGAVTQGGEVFDEDFVTYKEDVDLAWRLQNAGYDAWHLPAAIAYHDRSLGGAKGVLNEVRARRARHRENKVRSYANHLATVLKNDRVANLLVDLPWVLSHELAKFVFLLATDPRTLWRGVGGALRLVPRMLRKRKFLKGVGRRSSAELRLWWSRFKIQP